jgi:predicted metalloprotease with PDZ domain
MGRAIGLLTVLLLLSAASQVIAQSPVLHYTLRIDSSDLTGYAITIRIDHAPHWFRLAMATHHEYDDRYWRFVTGFRLSAPASFTREDSAVWAITAPGRTVIVTYRIKLPPPGPTHFSHRPFLAPYGGLVGDMHSFMYLVETPHAPCTLTLLLPNGWQAASGLDPVTTVPKLLDAPILVGRLLRWPFKVGNTPHEIVWLSSNPIVPFDTFVVVPNIQEIVRTTAILFGRFPYKHYSFLLEDSSAGALEHSNSVTIGVSGGELASDRSDIYEEIAHECFHSWNLKAIQPSGYTELNYGPQQQSSGLWFSEGVTMMYADLIGRRIGLPVEDSTRLAHLAALITRYYADTGNTLLPPARVSLASNLQPGPLGDYSASTHLQGELLGACLDILIRDRTDGHHSLDDVMRVIYRRFGYQKPLRDSDIEAAVMTVCESEEVGPFFHKHVYEGEPLDFAPWLHRLGLRITHDQSPATDSQGRALPDTRVYSWIRRDDTSLRIGVTNPKSCWAQAGLHTGDIISSINGQATHTPQNFRAVVGTLRVGDTAIVGVKKEAGSSTYLVPVCGYTTPLIRIAEDPAASSRQQRLLRSWLAAAGELSSMPVVDTSLYTILSYDSSVMMAMYEPFGIDSPVPAVLTADEVNKMERLIDSSYKQYNRENPREKLLAPLNDYYRRQYVAVTNSRGEKEVWVSFLCALHDQDWKHHAVIVDDGGLCFFQLKINLSTGKVSGLSHGGYAWIGKVQAPTHSGAWVDRLIP